MQVETGSYNATTVRESVLDDVVIEFGLFVQRIPPTSGINSESRLLSRMEEKRGDQIHIQIV